MYCASSLRKPGSVFAPTTLSIFGFSVLRQSNCGTVPHKCENPVIYLHLRPCQFFYFWFQNWVIAVLRHFIWKILIAVCTYDPVNFFIAHIKTWLLAHCAVPFTLRNAVCIFDPVKLWFNVFKTNNCRTVPHHSKNFNCCLHLRYCQFLDFPF